MEIINSIKKIYERIFYDPGKYNIDFEKAMMIFGYLLSSHTPEQLTEYASASEEQFYAVINSLANPMPPPSNQYPRPPPSPHPTSNEFLGNQLRLHVSSSSNYRGLNAAAAPYMPLNDQYSRPAASTSSFRGPAWHDPRLTSNAQLGGGFQDPRGSMRSAAAAPTKTCYFFNSGFCSQGNKCTYSHGGIPSDVKDDHDLSPGLLEKLSAEISELLKRNKRNPIPISNLPKIYSDRYGKPLQAEGYLTQRQRRGKAAGFCLTDLLARLKTIQLIDQLPHGPHSVVLAEDAPKYMECNNEKSTLFITFSHESTFTKDDVINYFA